jgi:hypothetical protein
VASFDCACTGHRGHASIPACLARFEPYFAHFQLPKFPWSTIAEQIAIDPGATSVKEKEKALGVDAITSVDATLMKMSKSDSPDINPAVGQVDNGIPAKGTVNDYWSINLDN